MSTLGDVQYIGGYHDAWGGGDKSLSIYTGNPDVLNIPQCTHDISHIHHDIPPMYS